MMGNDPVEKPEKPSLSGMLIDLDELYKHLEDAERAKSEAYSRCTDILEHVNRLQGRIDEAVDEVRRAAPQDTDWGSERGSG